MFAEAIGGWLTNSLALLADAGHMLTDVAALSLTLAAIWFASRPATAKKTFGYYRLEILAAFVNGIALVLIVVAFSAQLRQWRLQSDGNFRFARNCCRRVDSFGSSVACVSAEAR